MLFWTHFGPFSPIPGQGGQKGSFLAKKGQNGHFGHISVGFGRDFGPLCPEWAKRAKMTQKPPFSGIYPQNDPFWAIFGSFWAIFGQKPGFWALFGPLAQVARRPLFTSYSYRVLAPDGQGLKKGQKVVQNGSFLTHFWVIFGPLFGPLFGLSQPPAALGVKRGPK